MRDLFRADYRAHAVFVSPVGDRHELWRFGVGLVLIASIFLVLVQALGQMLLSGVAPVDREAYIEQLFSGDTSISSLFLLSNYALLIPAVAIVTLALHQRTQTSLLGPLRPAWTQFRAVFFVLLLLIGALLVLPPYSFPGGELISNLAFGRWLVLLPLSFVVLALQCAAEEIAFRGYIQQQLAARFGHPGFWMFLPAGLFAGLHYAPEIYGPNAIIVAASAGLFGLVMADITARAGTLGPAIAIHLANNSIAILLVGSPDSLSGLALYHSQLSLSDPDLVWSWLSYDLGWIFVSWLAARLAIRR